MYLLAAIIKQMAEVGSSDFHIRTNKVPYITVHGDVHRDITTTPTRKESVEAMVAFLLQLKPFYSDEVQEQFKSQMIENKSVNFSVSTQDSPELLSLDVPHVRFRLSVFVDKDGLGIVGRLLSDQVRDLSELGFDRVLIERMYEICNRSSGLVLVTGPTGSGKTTTLAACINYINRMRADHIITLEDPIEILYGQYSPHIEGSDIYKSLITQREVPRDTPSFTVGLHDALRQAPNTILVGELRNADAMELAFNAAETGHLVFATLHTRGGFQTLNRIIAAFESDRKEFIQQQLGSNLNCILSQRLLRKKDNSGRALCYEYLESIDSVRSAIFQGKIARIAQAMEFPCITWNSRLAYLLDQGEISHETYEANVVREQDDMVSNANA